MHTVKNIKYTALQTGKNVKPDSSAQRDGQGKGAPLDLINTYFSIIISIIFKNIISTGALTLICRLMSRILDFCFISTSF